LVSMLLSAHPLAYVRCAVDEPHALRLTSIQKPDNIDIHQRHFIQLQHGPWTAGVQLPFHLRKILRSNSTDQPDGRPAPVDSLFDFQGHAGASKRNERAIGNYCKDGKL
jgi:hypothetical protein